MVLDGYRLIRPLGRGGFGEVWLCESGAVGNHHALKFVTSRHPSLLEKEHEALVLYRKAASSLRSPHLTPIEHINRTDAGLYYVMPLADGVSGSDPCDPGWQPLSLTTIISDRLNQPGWFSSDEVKAWMQPVLQALQALTGAGLVHRDVKPDNILFFGGCPCLGDISLLGVDVEGITRRGTPGYATPSWYVGGHPDMYGAAATLYTLLTGNQPDKMGRTAFRWPPEGEASLSTAEKAEWKRLHGIVRRATDERVSERFADFDALEQAISNAAGVVGASRSQRRWINTTVISLALAAGAFAFAYQALVSSKSSIKTTGGRPAEPQIPLTKDEKADYVALAGMIQGYLDDHRYDLALASVDELLSTHPQARGKPAYSVARAMALKGLGRTREAKEELRREVNLTPDLAAATARISLWEEFGDYHAAEEDLSRVLTKFGANTLMLRQRAEIRIQLHDYAGAQEDRKSALAIRGSDPAQQKAVDLLWTPLEQKYPEYSAYLDTLKKPPHDPNRDNGMSARLRPPEEMPAPKIEPRPAVGAKAIPEPVRLPSEVPEVAPATPPSRTLKTGSLERKKGGLSSAIHRAVGVPGAAADGDPLKMDLCDSLEVEEIFRLFDLRNYADCLELLDKRLKEHPVIRKRTLCILLRALLLQELGRDEEMARELNCVAEDSATIPWMSATAATKAGKSAPLKTGSPFEEPQPLKETDVSDTGRTLDEADDILLIYETMGRHQDGERYAAGVIKSVLARLSDFQPGEILEIHASHARFEILLNRYDLALLDAAKLKSMPLDFTDPEKRKHAGEVRDTRIQNIHARWQLLEEEFPAFREYTEKLSPW